jgi:Bifunctional DNA primase/polymerase, N-terminal
MTMLDAALSYAGRGWHIFPVPSGTKKSHKKAEHSGGRKWGKTTDANEIRRDFKQWPDANVGIATGPDSGFFVVEVDTTKGGHAHDGFASLAMLLKEHGPLPVTLTAESPSGSRHFYFAWPKDIAIRNSTSKIAPGIDVRGDGGMVVAPPSLKNGKAYRWLNEGAPIVDAPAWLIALAVKAKKQARPTTRLLRKQGGGPTRATVEQVAKMLAIIPPAEDFDTFNTVGMACFASNPDSFEAFDAWAKRAKNSGGTVEKWNAYFACPPDRIGFAKLEKLAEQELHRRLEEKLWPSQKKR